MKKHLIMLLAAFVFVGCQNTDQPNTEVTTETTEEMTEATTEAQTETIALTIIDGADDGELLLAAKDDAVGGVFIMTVGETPVTLDGETASAADLKDGMTIDVTYSGMMMRSFPGQLGGVESINAHAFEEGQVYDIAGLFFQIVDDIWQKNPQLVDELNTIAVDLEQAPGGLSESEKTAILYHIGQKYGFETISGNYDTLVETGVLEKDAVIWKDGVIVTIAPPQNASEENHTLQVDASIWRGDEAAIYYHNIAADYVDGQWNYTID